MMAAACIRRARLADADELHALVCELEGERFDRDAFRARLVSQLAGDGYRCLVAERAGRVVGMLNLRIEVQLHHERPAAEIVELIVTAEAREAGVGMELVACARLLAEDAGCEVFEVTSNLVRERAHRFYERQGMTKSHYRLSMMLPVAQVILTGEGAHGLPPSLGQPIV